LEKGPIYSPDNRPKVLEAGCTLYFEKPIDPLTIVDRIHAFLRLAGNNATVGEEH
jgi:DNA-binding response OmpR family regulator